MVPRSEIGGKPQVHSFDPSDPTPSTRSRNFGIPVVLRASGLSRLLFRGRVTWFDPSTRCGLREEIVTFADPRKLLRLLDKIRTKPDRPLLKIDLEAMARPRWEPVSLEWVVSRAEQRERRDASEGGAG